MDDSTDQQNSNEPTCGQELAADAGVPQKLAELWSHVADGLSAHAHWVGTDSPEAALEHASLLAIAQEYRAVAAAASRASTIMKSLSDLPRALHDPERANRVQLARWMRHKIELQQEFAAMILSHAALSEQALAQLEPLNP
jgi:hypothetical protein